MPGERAKGAAGSAKRTFWGSMMKSARHAGDAHTVEIEAVAVEHITAEPVEAAESRWPIPPVRGEASLGTSLSELLAQETPDDLLNRLAVFKRSVEEALRRSSSAFHILRQLEESGLKDCARCTRELEARLANNPHYLVLGKIAEAEKLVTELRTYRL
jgi:hypothetical protein